MEPTKRNHILVNDTAESIAEFKKKMSDIKIEDIRRLTVIDHSGHTSTITSGLSGFMSPTKHISVDVGVMCKQALSTYGDCEVTIDTETDSISFIAYGIEVYTNQKAVIEIVRPPEARVDIRNVIADLGNLTLFKRVCKGTFIDDFTVTTFNTDCYLVILNDCNADELTTRLEAYNEDAVYKGYVIHYNTISICDENKPSLNIDKLDGDTAIIFRKEDHAFKSIPIKHM